MGSGESASRARNEGDPHPGGWGELNEVVSEWEDPKTSPSGRTVRRLVVGGHHGHFETLTARRSPTATYDSHNASIRVEKVCPDFGEVS